MSASKTVASVEIRAPLLAFEHVHRCTGTIRKTCMFRNLSDQPVELEVRYGFREHSWLRLEIDRQEPDDARLVVPPGEIRVHLLMNTDSSNFPYDRFRGRVYFHDDNNNAVFWIEISFEQIDELEDFDGYAAIDLGTSNSVIAVYHLEQDAIAGAPWTPVLEGDGVDVPSAVFIGFLPRPFLGPPHPRSSGRWGKPHSLPGSSSGRPAACVAQGRPGTVPPRAAAGANARGWGRPAAE